MQADCVEAAPSGKEESKSDEAKEKSQTELKTNELKTKTECSEPKKDDGWDKFYSMPPYWRKFEAGQTASESSQVRDERPANHSSNHSSSRSGSGLTDENIGHKLASLLRYHADENNISSDQEGWVLIAQIIKEADNVGLINVTEEDLIRVADTNEHGTRGRRFEYDGEGRIRATYKHPPKDRRDRWDFFQARMRRPRGYGGWHDGWRDSSSWRDGGWQEWGSWKRELGFSPSPDDDPTQESSWEEAKAQNSNIAATRESDSERKAVAETEATKEPCDWEQWFTPETEEPYFYNAKTEEFFFPTDSADIAEKGWARYLDSEGGGAGKIYWWHDETGRSFYEDDAIGNA